MYILGCSDSLKRWGDALNAIGGATFEYCACRRSQCDRVSKRECSKDGSNQALLEQHNGQRKISQSYGIYNFEGFLRRERNEWELRYCFLLYTVTLNGLCEGGSTRSTYG